MTTPTIREFIDRHLAAAAGLAALGALLDARAHETSVDAALGARIDELLAELGGSDLLAGVTPREAAIMLGLIRHQRAFDGKLLQAETRATSWSYDDPDLLCEIGDFSRVHAHGLTNDVVPALEGLAERFATRDAAFLDIGVGVAGLAMEMAGLWPRLRIVGIDVWRPSLTLAHERVARAGMSERIELREQAAERLDDEETFDLAWLPLVFMAEATIPMAAERTLRALRPGGWVAAALIDLGCGDATSRAFWRLRTAMFGGPQWLPGRVEAMLRDAGYADVRTLPSPPGIPVVLVVGRRIPR